MKLDVIRKFANVRTGSPKILDVLSSDYHPKQIINLTDPYPLSFYEVTYEYTTIRDNRKEGTKICILNTYSPEVNIKEKFMQWIEQHNKINSDRPLLNVKILKSENLGLAVID